MLHNFTIDPSSVSFRCSYSSFTPSASKFSVPSVAKCPTAVAPLMNPALLYIIMCRSVSQNASLSNSVSTSSLITRSIRLNSMLLRLLSIRPSPSQSRMPTNISAFSLLLMIPNLLWCLRRGSSPLPRQSCK